MRLLVTGGTGFIGSNFVGHAVAAGHAVRALRRPGATPRVAVPDAVEWVDGALDAAQPALFDGIDAVVHLAAHSANPPYASFADCMHWNVWAATRFVEAAAGAGVGRIVVAGTCFEYGAAGEGHAFLHPGLETRPALSYPVSKAAASQALMGLARDRGLRMQVLRIFQAFGPGEAETRLWPGLRAAANAGRDFPMSPGQQVRDFIHVDDVSRRFVAALAFDGVEPGRPVVRNVGTGRPQTLLDFATHWWRHWQASGRLLPGAVGYRAGEVMRIVADVDAVHVA